LISLARTLSTSGTFSPTRKVGIGLALIDTVIYGRAPVHARAIITRLQTGDLATARAVGIPAGLFAGHHGPIDDFTRGLLEPMVQKLALVQAINDAWLMVAAVTCCALVILPLARARPTASRAIEGRCAAGPAVLAGPMLGS